MSYLEQLRFWVWERLGALVDLIHPGYLTADPTPRRVQRFYDLMHEVQGGPEEAEVLMETPQGPVDTSQMAEAEKQKGEDERAAEKAQEIRNAFMKEDRLEELADTVLDLPRWKDPGDVPLNIVTHGTVVFIVGYSKRIIELTGTRNATE